MVVPHFYVLGLIPGIAGQLDCIGDFVAALALPKPGPCGVGVLASFRVAMDWLENLPANELPLPDLTAEALSNCGTLGDSLLIKDSALAVPTEKGWRFKAGCTVCTADALLAWKGLGADDQLLAELERGWGGCACNAVSPAYFLNHNLSTSLTPSQLEDFDNELTALWRMGAIRQVTQGWVQKHGPPIVVMPTFPVFYDTKTVVIWDARFANVFETAPTFVLPSSATIADLAAKSSHWAKMDFKSGWYHMRITGALQRLFCFRWKDRMWTITILPFGLSSAPWKFTQLLNVLHSHWMRQHYTIARYIDDISVWKLKVQFCSDALLKSAARNPDVPALMIRDLLSVGGVLSAKKCYKDWVCMGDLLGFMWNTEDGWASVNW